MSDELVMFTMWAHMTAELMKRNARDAAGSSCGQKTTQGACVSSRAVQDRGRQLNQAIFDPWQRSLFSRQRTPGKEPLLAGKAVL